MASRDLNLALSGKARVQLMTGELEEFGSRTSSNRLVVNIHQRAESIAGAGGPVTARVPGASISDPVQQRSMSPGKVELF